MNNDLSWSSVAGIWDFLFASPYSPWLQLCLAAVLLIFFNIYKRFSEAAAIEAGLYICYFWIPLCAALSLFSDDFWLYFLHWALSMLAFFIIYFMIIYLCEKYGSPYMGDGAMAMLLPIYIFGFSFIVTVVLYGIIRLTRCILN